MSEKALTSNTEDLAERISAITDREGKYLTFSVVEEEYGIGILIIRMLAGVQAQRQLVLHPALKGGD